jgi:uncharacterized membrane protein
MIVFDGLLGMMGFIFLIASLIMVAFPPNKPNAFYGYRTTRAMKNQENWEFAQKYSTRIMFFVAVLMISIQLIDEYFIGFLAKNKIGSFITALIFVGLLYFLTEKKLKETFPD